jgi:hypothetical protein
MNFNTIGLWGPFFSLLFWALPLVLVILAIWFVRTLRAIAFSLRDIANRLSDLERAVRDSPPESNNLRR